MLILTRKAGQQIHIGDDIIVRVIAIKGTIVQIGVQAQSDIAVDRDEVRTAKLKDRVKERPDD
ncbi:carbon storage regulator [Pseudomonas sp. RIT-To-2]|uniref:carbon storage regulator n=1 Tax=Pseudomonas sp. RIT-To-2 TaxID=3462541 RepID=UPI002413ABDD